MKSKVLSGLFWSFLQGIGGRGISFIVTIILARILTPEMFGLIGMLTIFMQVSGVLVTAGFNEALIQKKKTDEKDYSSVFWINLSVSILLFALLFFTAPLISDFYKQPILTPMMRVLSVVFIINAFSYVQETRLKKKMSFKKLMIIHLPAVTIAGITSIIMALKGFGVWSLVAMEVITRLTYTIQIWIYSKWKPLWSLDRERVRGLFSFGSKLMISSILTTLFNNSYLVVIGKFFPLGTLGYYQTARNYVKTPATTLSNVLNSVTFPAFSSIQDKNKRLKEAYKKAIQQLVFWMCPLFVLAGVMAEPLFRFIFTEKWLPAVPFFQILCIMGVFYPLNTYNINIIKVKGHSGLYLKLNIIRKIIIIIGIASTLPFGIWPLVIFQAANNLIAYAINSSYSGRFIQYSMKEQLKDVFPIFSLALVAGGVAWLLDNILSGLPDIFRLILGFGCGAGVYWIGAILLNLEPFVELKEILKMAKNRFFVRKGSMAHQPVR